MRTQTRENIVAFIGAKERATAKAIIEHVGLSAPAVFMQLKKLLNDGVLNKQGNPPKVFYFVAKPSPVYGSYALDPDNERIINENFLKIGANGILQKGKSAFIQWCVARGLDPIKTSAEYVSTLRRYDAHHKDGLIDGTSKLKATFSQTYVDKLYYLDFYSIERFEKTKLGEMILYSKQSQNTALMRAVASEVRPRILKMIEDMKIDAVGFIPPTVKRDVQFMKELETMLHLPIKHIKITKIKTPIIVPQKTLSKLEERVENAHQSLIVEDEGKYMNVLLIDDAVASGATINEIARQVSQKKMCAGEIIGLAIVGSFKGFEVIQEA